MNVTEPLRRLALTLPDRPALVGCDDTVIDYETLDELIDLVGLEAERRGLGPGDVVGLDLAGLDQFRALVVALGLARRGVATAASLAGGLKLRVLTGGQPAPPPGTPPARQPAERLDQFWDGMAAGRGDIPLGPIHPDPAAPFRIFSSSGTTGRPKTMLIDHRMMARRVYDQSHALIPFSPVHAPAVALSTTWGMTQALRTLWAGGALVLSHTAALHGAVLRHGVTSIACAPIVLAEILAAMPAEAPPPPTLLRVEVSGSALPAKLRRQAEARLCPVVINYIGSAEAGGVASAAFALLDAAPPGAAGYLHPGVRAEAVDENDRPLPPGAQGLLRVRTMAPVAGYLDDPKTTAEQFRDGWFYPGDLGAVTADGLLIVNGRASEVINAGGVKVAPTVIEQALDERPEVIECAAFGAPDSDGVTRVWAAVVADEPVDAAALTAYLASRLGDIAPRRLMQVSSLPRNANGKVLRSVLTEMAARPGHRAPRV